MNHKKVLIVAVTLLLAALVIVLGFRWLQRAVFGAARVIQEMGEAPLSTQDVWVSPTLAPDAGNDWVEAETPESSEAMAEDEPFVTPEPEEALVSVPVIQSPEELSEENG